MKPRNPFAPITYTIMDELMASPTHPLPEKSRLHQLTVMWQGLAALETAPHPTKNDWRVVSEAVNLMETFIRTMGICEDNSGLLLDAITALALAGKRTVDEANRCAWTAPASRPPARCWKTTPPCSTCCPTAPWCSATATPSDVCARSWRGCARRMTWKWWIYEASDS